jgi:hypothetical protein
MPWQRIVLIVLLGMVQGSRCWAQAAKSHDRDLEGLIDKLVETSELGFGYSTLSSGSQFLPYADSERIGTLVLGSRPPSKSPVLEAIVRNGASAVPFLMKHLDDQRKTKIEPVRGMMWTAYDDEYDFNRRTRREKPEGVNRHAFMENHPFEHQITVGDLCFVAVGQIVNRSFNATRYQPSGGMVVSSPSYSRRLCEVVRRDFSVFSQEQHKALLIQDFLLPDREYRRIGAYWRLSLYYPQEVEPLVLKQLKVPAYDVQAIWPFIHTKLYPERDTRKRGRFFEAFVREHGPASRAGILLELFDDLDMQESDERGSLSPPLKEKYDARALLGQLYGYAAGVKSVQKPYVDTWDVGEQARFIEAATHDKSRKIDEAVHDVFLQINDDDYFALACIRRLLGRGYEKEIRAYCSRRLGKDEYYLEKLREVTDELDKIQKKRP